MVSGLTITRFAAHGDVVHAVSDESRPRLASHWPLTASCPAQVDICPGRHVDGWSRVSSTIASHHVKPRLRNMQVIAETARRMSRTVRTRALVAAGHTAEFGAPLAIPSRIRLFPAARPHAGLASDDRFRYTALVSLRRRLRIVPEWSLGAYRPPSTYDQKTYGLSFDFDLGAGRLRHERRSGNGKNYPRGVEKPRPPALRSQTGTATTAAATTAKEF